MDIYELVKKCTSLAKDGVDPADSSSLDKIEYTPELSVTEEIEEGHGPMVPYIAAQIAANPKELSLVEKLAQEKNPDWDLFWALLRMTLLRNLEMAELMLRKRKS